MKKFLVTTLIGGLLVLLPLAIFIVILNFVYNILQNFVEPIVKLFAIESLPIFILNLLALSVVVGFCFIVGLAVRTQIGKEWFNFLELNILAKLPFYNTIKEIVQQVFGRKESSFSQVVLVKVFGSTMTGFVTDQSKNGIYTIFVPTAPNPTNGFVIHMPEHEITFLPTAPEDAMRTIIGVGTGSHILFDSEIEAQLIDGETAPNSTF